jgi:hypothetical protein
MAVVAEVIAGILIAVLLVATALSLFVGLMGTVFSEGIERCTRCGHWTLGYHGLTHPQGCPGTLYEDAAHVLQAAFHHVHLRHH